MCSLHNCIFLTKLYYRLNSKHTARRSNRRKGDTMEEMEKKYDYLIFYMDGAKIEHTIIKANSEQLAMIEFRIRYGGVDVQMIERV